jgi:peptide deformylase
MALNFVLFNNPIIHKVCAPVTQIDESILKLVGEMLVAMKVNRGIGLAANQVGVDLRLAVVSVEKGTKNFAIINPVILSQSKEKETMTEGCLSCPGVSLPVKRSKKIVVQCLDLNGTEVTYELTDLEARIFQHEIDHLNGHCIVDLVI